MIVYECGVLAVFVTAALLVISLDRGAILGPNGTLAWVRAQRGQAMSGAVIGALILAVVAVIAVLAIQPIRAKLAVTACENNLRTIQGALAAYELDTNQAYPSVSNLAVTVYQGGSSPTAGTFSDPNQISEDYLGEQPHDPADPTGSYTLTVVSGTSYTITCPGGHPLWTLKGLTNGSSATKGQIQLNASGLSAL